MRRFLLALLLSLASMPLAAQSPIPDGATPERIAAGFQFTEGPVWMDGGLLFSDIPANRIYRWTPEDGATVFRTPSQKSNGLALDASGRLLIAQHAARRVARLENGVETVLADAYQGSAFNSPNDIAVHPDGSLYFTDPTWGLEGRPAQLGYTGVFRLDPQGTVHLLDATLYQPNGIAFSPDLATLYVTTSDQRQIVAFDLADHALSNKRVLATLPGNGAADGMLVDASGRLYVTGPRGLWVLAPDGTVLDVVDVPGQTSNVAWGQTEGETLYLTSGPGVYRLSLLDPTATAPPPEAQPAGASGVSLESLSPNPASGATAVAFRVGPPQEATLVVVDSLGREVQRHALGVLEAGEHRHTLDLSRVASGVYTVQIQTAGGLFSAKRLTVSR